MKRPCKITVGLLAPLAAASLFIPSAAIAAPFHREDTVSAGAALSETHTGARILAQDLGAVQDSAGRNVLAGSLNSTADTVFTSKDGLDSRISVEPSGEVNFSAEGSPGFSISFPDASAQLSRQDSRDPLSLRAGKDAAIVPQFVGSSFRGLFVLKSEASPTSFAVDVSGPDNARLAPTADGGVSIVDSSGDEVGGILAPWAKDSHNKNVPTRFEVERQRLVQIVDTSGLRAEDFPVVADPAVYVNVTRTRVIHVQDRGVVKKWKYLNKCTARKGKSCSIRRVFGARPSIGTAFHVSAAWVGAQIGISNGEIVKNRVFCSVRNGPGSVTLYASAKKKTYRVQKITTKGVAVPGHGHTKTTKRTSGTLTAYKPNGGYLCS
jgi:hypothetical protein